MPRPSSPLLSSERIRQGALEIIDTLGLEALSMRRLAEHLGVRAASLYNHVPTKEDLLHDLANTVMDQIDVSDFERDWATGLATWARSYRAALAAHPNLVPFIASGPARREAALRRADAVHGGLTRAGWPQRYATMIGASTKYLVVGGAMGSFSHGFVDDADLYGDHFPNLAQAHLLRKHAVEIDNDSFELALAALIEGLRQLYSELPTSGASTTPEK
ncbi:TetR family transcriptional regulator [Halopolyspora algeriensis]|uniref:TetR family transcriptional regulator n=1 Tax=Halopolyspora algeriensis TaxID=1500506 RepID=A0A368VRU7_9ACTN|nr:TetR/AcrR family transcriptional regulator C-terminal domain-containing protein [Halopolyspora algeriensis]RCW43187.1 TetR family transcriptional regulator [Halopolyspora algeriensis]TQM56245.1 TetR family transcriptional regulator [Halopolyspora algeriensis]